MSIDLFDETRALLVELERAEVPYALAGALALAIHGAPRATTDIDILLPPDRLEEALASARRCGFDVSALPMRFADGLEVRRASKIRDDETLSVDFLLLDANLEPVWNERIRLETDFGSIAVVSRDGLIRMKGWAGREQDLADIRRLRELDR